ncbi:MAG: carboxylesterase [Gammaproteobacteria bacterium]|nr:MAG: carboxylesterase [Gammaproteobacteria bacterium]
MDRESDAVTELQTVDIETGSEPDTSIIWMHGLGADANDFAPAVPMLQLDSGRAVRFVFPNAPIRPVTLNGGMQMRAWFDLISLDRDAPQDEAGIRAAADGIEALIQRECDRGIAAERIVIAGFSQGGAMALFTALRYPEKLAGIVALSTYVPVAHAMEPELSAANHGLPIFMAHGPMDEVVPFNFARSSRKRLHQLGYDVEWHEYPMGHSVIPEELQDIKAFLERIVG